MKSSAKQRQSVRKKKSGSPYFLWITDPWNTLDHPRDTTLRLMEEASKIGIPQSWCDVKTIRLEGSRVVLDSVPILAIKREPEAVQIQWGKAAVSEPKDFSSLQYRVDPPVDSAYIHPLHLLKLGLREAKKSKMVNSIDVLLTANEKVEGSVFSNLMPPSLVSSQWEHFEKFGRLQKKTVLKPLHEAQSHGIELLDWTTSTGIENAKELLHKATQGFSTPVLLQKFLRGITEGEVRLWFLDGKLLACVKKHPMTGDFRVNMDRGSRLGPHQLTPVEKKKAIMIGKHLRTLKVRLAAVDLIEGLITDFNFTSPGLIPLMEDLLKANLARPIVQALLKTEIKEGQRHSPVE